MKYDYMTNGLTLNVIPLSVRYFSVVVISLMISLLAPVVDSTILVFDINYFLIYIHVDIKGFWGFIYKRFIRKFIFCYNDCVFY